MMPPITAATARTAMIQLEPPSRPFFFETAEAERAPSNAVAAEAATGVATIEVAASAAAAFLSEFMIIPFITNSYSMNNDRSEEHTSELQSLMRISYAVFCL